MGGRCGGWGGGWNSRRGMSGRGSDGKVREDGWLCVGWL